MSTNTLKPESKKKIYYENIVTDVYIYWPLFL